MRGRGLLLTQLATTVAAPNPNLGIFILITFRVHKGPSRHDVCVPCSGDTIVHKHTQTLTYIPTMVRDSGGTKYHRLTRLAISCGLAANSLLLANRIPRRFTRRNTHLR